MEERKLKNFENIRFFAFFVNFEILLLTWDRRHNLHIAKIDTNVLRKLPIAQNNATQRNSWES